MQRGELAPIAEARATMHFAYATLEQWQRFLSRPKAGPMEVDEAVLLARGIAAVEAGTGTITVVCPHRGHAYRRA